MLLIHSWICVCGIGAVVVVAGREWVGILCIGGSRLFATLVWIFTIEAFVLASGTSSLSRASHSSSRAAEASSEGAVGSLMDGATAICFVTELVSMQSV